MFFPSCSYVVPFPDQEAAQVPAQGHGSDVHGRDQQSDPDADAQFGLPSCVSCQRCQHGHQWKTFWFHCATDQKVFSIIPLFNPSNVIYVEVR